jgi:hypothetical protein
MAFWGEIVKMFKNLNGIKLFLSCRKEEKTKSSWFLNVKRCAIDGWGKFIRLECLKSVVKTFVERIAFHRAI